jgi:glycerol-3-phosphate dehydrogenase (NAD(P)+)
MRVCVLGAGSWGTALAILLARNGHEVALWGRDEDEMEALASVRENRHYLPGFALPEEVHPTSDSSKLPDADLWVVAVPSTGVRDCLRYVYGTNPLVVIASKGLEPGSSLLLTQVAEETRPGPRIAALSGPNLAVEMVRGIPTAAVAAARSESDADAVREAFTCRTYRVYVSQDVIGIPLAGALKNVLAIAAGVSDGLGFGDNTKGALLARGLREVILLGLAMGGKLESFLGIAGVGDLYATAVSRLSRNYRVGRSLGEGQTLQQALHEVGQVAEGVDTAEAAVALARRHQVETPVFEAAAAVVHGSLKPLDAVTLLMERMTRTEGIVTGRG